MNKLYFGDNLQILREHISAEDVDLVYLDPPFNSKTDYNLLFKSPDGSVPGAQALAFEDTWRWGEAAEAAFRYVIHAGGPAARLLGSLRLWLQESDMMAYLAMMTVRLAELHRVLKPTGSLYLHCDPSASHYLKIMLDAIFGPACFRSELVWKRTNARGTKGKWPALHDCLLFYSKTGTFTFHPQLGKADRARMPHTLITGADGLKYQTFELTGPGVTKDGESGREWRGFNPSSFGRHWGQSEIVRESLDLEGLIHWPANGGFPRRRAAEPFNAEARMVTIGDVWTDIDRLNQTAKERLGYPTQKPLALLERIIAASSSRDEVVLDPFCGCGTTVHAAQSMHRNWIGIDVTNYAVKLIQTRLEAAFPDLRVDVDGRPQDFQDAAALAQRDKYQFQWWACDVIGAQRYRNRQKGPDGGVDGEIMFLNGPRGVGRIIVSVKGGKSLGVDAVRELRAVIDQQGADMGVLVSLAQPSQQATNAALSAGFVRTAHGEYPRLQITPVSELFERRMPRLPMSAPASLLRPPPPPKTKKDRQLRFTFSFDGQQYQRPPVEDGVVLDPRVMVGLQPARRANPTKEFGR